MGSFANARNFDPFPERGKLMPETEDQWRTVFQVLPKDLYDRFFAQMKRLGHANAIPPAMFELDTKTQTAIGPRVMAFECLVILMERSENEAFKV
jgi:hypothetical protein